jgi:hypothetical protein
MFSNYTYNTRVKHKVNRFGGNTEIVCAVGGLATILASDLSTESQEATLESQDNQNLEETTGGESTRERSKIDFTYSDLDSSIETATGVYEAGGACDSDQLAAYLKMEPTGGGFRLRTGAAKMFGFVTIERGKFALTDLGRKILDPDQEKAARVEAFLNVELNRKIYENHKGYPLPPQAGLDRFLVNVGVGEKTKERARQVFMRSAKQAGFFESRADRLIMPVIKNGGGGAETKSKSVASEEGAANVIIEPSAGTAKRGGNGGDGRVFHPFIDGLLKTLPPEGSEWSTKDRMNWLSMACIAFKMIYTTNDGNDIKIEIDHGL